MAEIEDEDLKEGILRKKEGKTLASSAKWRDKYIVISGRSIFWFKDQKEAISNAKKRNKHKDQAYLVGATIKQNSEDFNPPVDDAPIPDGCFQVVCPDGNTLILCANNDVEKRDWVDVLKAIASGRGDQMSRETVEIQERLRKSGHDIPASDLDLDEEDRVLGSGVSGVVRRGRWLKSTEVAVKALKNLPEFTEISETIAFFKEIETLSQLRHINIVQMYGFCKKDNYICLVTEFVRGGNLAHCLSDHENFYLDFALQIELSLSICRGMVYLHSKGVIHRDLKPANILIESWPEGKVKVCDFGLSVVQKKSATKTSGENYLGSPQYAAPELTADSHDNKVDVFSFAIILYEIALRKAPWPEISFGSQFAEKYARGDRPPIPADNPFRVLIQKCWVKAPAQRPSFVDIYEEVEKIRVSDPTVHDVDPQLKRRETVAAIPKTTSTPSPPQRTQSQTMRTQSSNNVSPVPPMQRTQTAPSPHQHTVLNNNNSNNTVPKTQNIRRSLDDKVSQMFATKDKETWDNFAQALQLTLGANLDKVSQLRYLFDVGGIVTKAMWVEFMKWFSPVSSDPDAGWTIDQMIDICTPHWFHGFMSSQDAQNLLKGQPDGTYLIRFSTSAPGSYALSVSYNETVGHW
eukprot:CAMPEP_0168556248 /NCGR_PEP_ID=MMETSP0413-20121227/8776_1 /TAXON_ID=136452 /ORGANISM="Filamoeba nolandi, Strain NC-AS-23-1" /LENGTH=632 /DNA_ID=CAMNT_0008587171 /DNA_START=113 /DNA_END=2008 /DNA_ORIENTATION=+